MNAQVLVQVRLVISPSLSTGMEVLLWTQSVNAKVEESGPGKLHRFVILKG